MEAKELRKGNIFNWINRTGYVHIPDNKPLEVIAIGVFSVESISQGLNLANLQNSLTIKLSDMSPIPLTEEWLKKQGAFFNYPEIIIQGFVMEELGPGEFYFTGGDGVKLSGVIRTVHKLQNIFYFIEDKELVIKE